MDANAPQFDYSPDLPKSRLIPTAADGSAVYACWAHFNPIHNLKYDYYVFLQTIVEDAEQTHPTHPDLYRVTAPKQPYQHLPRLGDE